ncbi:DUF1173 domain-containing protein [Bacillus sp. JZ8]
MWRVNGEKIDVTEISIERREKLFKNWYESKAKIECLCEKTNGKYPLLGIRRSVNNVLHPYSIGVTNRKRGTEHAWDCYHSTISKEIQKRLGIKILEDGSLSVNLKSKKNESPHDKEESLIHTSIKASPTTNRASLTRKSSLRNFILFLLQQINVHEYKSARPRDIRGRLYYKLVNSKINNQKLEDVMLLSHTGYRYNYKKHQFIIGCTNLAEVRQNAQHSWLIEIPMYSLSDPTRFVYNQNVRKEVYNNMSKLRADVTFGYIVIWREKDHNGKLQEKEIVFIESERETMIPVESSFEEIMLKKLVSLKKDFQKPLVMDIDEDIRPDFILLNKDKTVIEVAGMMDKEDYFTNMKCKQEYYKNKGIPLILWDTRGPIPHID